MAPTRKKAKSSSGAHRRVEANIYRAERSDASVRFTVSVYPLKALTKTVDRADEADGLDWARATRLELLRQKRSLPAGAPGTAHWAAIKSPDTWDGNMCLGGRDANPKEVHGRIQA